MPDAVYGAIDGTVANTTPFAFAGRLMALKEDSLPHLIDPETLEFEITGLKGARRMLETTAVPLATADGGYAQLGMTPATYRRGGAGARIDYVIAKTSLGGPARVVFGLLRWVVLLGGMVVLVFCVSLWRDLRRRRGHA